ncbi:unknown protein [Simkania negevensis Z]|uniref:Uncharacterized protein n=1 Tax=Simkania negevensis (strain ATCC VR-1471 / DSM 27360 / Z) TaxID=331113 RepID=F8L869_SIMNZ|nr:unknown protein [Simkania negevensis Z]
MEEQLSHTAFGRSYLSHSFYTILPSFFKEKLFHRRKVGDMIYESLGVEIHE